MVSQEFAIYGSSITPYQFIQGGSHRSQDSFVFSPRSKRGSAAWDRKPAFKGRAKTDALWHDTSVEALEATLKYVQSEFVANTDPLEEPDPSGDSDPLAEELASMATISEVLHYAPSRFTNLPEWKGSYGPRLQQDPAVLWRYDATLGSNFDDLNFQQVYSYLFNFTGIGMLDKLTDFIIDLQRYVVIHWFRATTPMAMKSILLFKLMHGGMWFTTKTQKEPDNLA
ncbi:hypothetical protein LTR10_016022 [Elasticomyces elasticus]|nr:hypothetical protein LTR10_016022 [Elasticomyces elasticus]